MIAEGLLWFDDDPRRPLVEKIAHAVERYSERTGWRPTVCEAHPTQVESFHAELARAAAAAQRRAASKVATTPAVTLPAKLRVTPSVAMRPNYFLIGIEAGETPRPAASPTVGRGASRKAKAEAPRDTTAAAAAPAASAPAAALATRRAPAKRSRAPRMKAS